MPSLILLRHGESAWNAEDRFTGRVNGDLARRGEQQARQCGLVLRGMFPSFRTPVNPGLSPRVIV
ncbi:phosphoglycerate mutase [Modestobacter muralis]|uniref:phosphoglycerate mutase (2,3-diphosphoglycerate-dependent) n=1 Tax=Modestobacter muralis TaxID=1608614 RepID=A0A6P0HAM1_9ACTN|nr:phosphoglycerate mutase [Modestobacter muralis]NEN52079.1 phosphoglycerate mutase [Modestobacter muralis]